MRSDWLVKLRISCAIYLRVTREKMASRFASVTSGEIIQINFLWCILSHSFSILLEHSLGELGDHSNTRLIPSFISTIETFGTMLITFSYWYY